MATLNPRRFAQLDSLKAINPKRLYAFLEPYKSYFHICGMTFHEEFHYEQLHSVLMKPNEHMDPAMVDALHYVHELATEEGMDALIQAATNAGIKLDYEADTTPADIAIQVWMQSPDTVIKVHAEMLATKPKSFQYYSSKEFYAKAQLDCSDAAITKLQKDLDSYFSTKNRGKGTNISVMDHGDEIFFLIRHGLPFKREGSLKEGKSETVFYRPETHDVLKYNRERNELGVRGDNKGQIGFYLEKVGLHLFGNATYFDNPEKYTLQPLKTELMASLVFSDVEGITSLRLTELQLELGKGEIDIRKSKHSCLTASPIRAGIPAHAKILSATFAIGFTGSKTTRSVKIRVPNVAIYTRDEDSPLIEEWLQKRGFIVQHEMAADDKFKVSVARA